MKLKILLIIILLKIDRKNIMHCNMSTFLFNIKLQINQKVINLSMREFLLFYDCEINDSCQKIICLTYI